MSEWRWPLHPKIVEEIRKVERQHPDMWRILEDRERLFERATGLETVIYAQAKKK